MAVAGLRRVSLVYDLSNGDQAVNVFHIRQTVPDPFEEVDAQGIATDFETDWWDEIRALISDNVTLDRIEVADASGSTGLRYSFDVGEAGTLVSDPLPFQTALVISLRTALNSRSGRGRIYQCGFGESQNTTSGEPSSAMRTTLQTAMTNLRTELTASGYELVVYSRTLDQANTVTSTQVDGYWDTQRRRANRR